MLSHIMKSKSYNQKTTVTNCSRCERILVNLFLVLCLAFFQLFHVILTLPPVSIAVSKAVLQTSQDVVTRRLFYHFCHIKTTLASTTIVATTNVVGTVILQVFNRLVVSLLVFVRIHFELCLHYYNSISKVRNTIQLF